MCSSDLGTLNVWQISNLNSLTLSNLSASNALTTVTANVAARSRIPNSPPRQSRRRSNQEFRVPEVRRVALGDFTESTTHHGETTLTPRGKPLIMGHENERGSSGGI